MCLCLSHAYQKPVFLPCTATAFRSVLIAATCRSGMELAQIAGIFDLLGLGMAFAGWLSSALMDLYRWQPFVGLRIKVPPL